MSKVRLVALKRFNNRGVDTEIGQEFEVNEGMVRDYLVGELARKVDSTTTEPEPEKRANKRKHDDENS
jgi:hypothetical protein